MQLWVEELRGARCFLVVGLPDGFVGRGLRGVALVISDAHLGLVDAIGATLAGASWQRCRTHYTVYLMSVCPKSAWPTVRTWLTPCLKRPTRRGPRPIRPTPDRGRTAARGP